MTEANLDHIAADLRPLARPIESFAHDETNARLHGASNLATIANSLRDFGQRTPIVAQRRKAKKRGAPDLLVVRKGNGTLDAARSLGWSSLAAVVIEEDDRMASSYAIADNRAAELAEWNLAEIVRQLDAVDASARAAVGFEEDDVLALIGRRDDPFVTERVRIDRLTPHPQNYQKHPKDQLEHIKKSITTHGYYRNIVVARDLTILAGHGVVEASRLLGRKTVPVIRLDLDPADPRALKVLTSDNEISNLAEVDDRALTELLRTIARDPTTGLSGTGFDYEQLAALTFVTRPESEIADKNHAADWVGMPEFTPTPDVFKIMVNFETEAAREDFMRAIGAKVIQKKFPKLWAIWYPERPRGKHLATHFDDTQKASAT